MSISKASHISSILRAALAVTVLMAGAAAVQAADPAPIQKEGSVSSQKNQPDSDALATNPNTANNADGKAVSDAWITTKVKSEILANSASKGLKVSVTTKRGVVALKGKLPTQDAADLVKNIALNVKGVQSVDASGLTVDSSSL
jgi:hyperosmotically inducible protein